MARIRRGWQLTKKSWAVLRGNPALVRFPLFGAAAAIVTTLAVIAPGLYLIESERVAFGAPLTVLGFYLLATAGIFFGVGLAATADMIFHGREAAVRDGMAVARSRFAQIASWAFVATAVGLIVNLIQERLGTGGAILGGLLSIGWSLITFLAVPVIALEGTGPIETLKRSAGLFRSRWGQQVTGNIAIGGAVLLLGVLPSVALIAAGIAIWASAGFAGALLVVLGVIGMAVAFLVARALSGIFGVALYRYALDGEAIGGFTAAELESAVRTKGGRHAPPTATPGTV